MANLNSLDLPFSIQPIEGKGFGAIAKRPLKLGELILAESPLFVQNRSRSADTIRVALSLLPVAQQRQYFCLANSHRETMHPFRGTFETNCLPLGNNNALTGQRANQGGIFLTASRFNSSCSPNVHHYYDEEVSQEKLHAMRDIVEGEELSVSYGELFQPRALRRAFLQRKFKFLCICTACALEGEPLQNSDTRRVEIGNLYEEIGSGGNHPRQTLMKVVRALSLLKQEGIYHYRDSFYYDGFQCCVMVSDFRNARSWIKLAHDVGAMYTGPDSNTLKKYRDLIEQPSSHQAAGLYPRAKLSGPPPLD